MFLPTGTAISEVLSWIRELSIIGVIITFAWRARGWYDAASIFLKRITAHMDSMEQFAAEAINNHLRGIETSCVKQEELLQTLVNEHEKRS